MIKEIITYPTPLSVEYATDVRVFNDELFALIEDLKDTINENNLKGLAAFQIGNYYNVIVVKDDNGDFIEMINPRLISYNGKVTTIESTAYYPNQTAEITRYENISVVYQDREGKDCSLKANGDFAVLIQRKIDYTFGASFIHKMSKEEKAKFEQKLEYGGDVGNSDYCPTNFKRDKIVLVMNVIMAAMALGLVLSFFINDNDTLEMLWRFLSYGAVGVVGLDVIYFFYAQYEGKKASGCSSCQIGNIIATAAIVLVKLSVIMALAYFFVYQ